MRLPVDRWGAFSRKGSFQSPVCPHTPHPRRADFTYLAEGSGNEGGHGQHRRLRAKSRLLLELDFEFAFGDKPR